MAGPFHARSSAAPLAPRCQAPHRLQRPDLRRAWRREHRFAPEVSAVADCANDEIQTQAEPHVFHPRLYLRHAPSGLLQPRPKRFPQAELLAPRLERTIAAADRPKCCGTRGVGVACGSYGAGSGRIAPQLHTPLVANEHQQLAGGAGVNQLECRPVRSHSQPEEARTAKDVPHVDEDLPVAPTCDGELLAIWAESSAVRIADELHNRHWPSLLSTA
mmetsp:Transcript_29610/g.89645  ORF Transcript_29610/g.89645 Transcript_29610/m.89645 type:complete len:217 (+) Transcript_29610:170-820(+)